MINSVVTANLILHYRIDDFIEFVPRNSIKCFYKIQYMATGLKIKISLDKLKNTCLTLKLRKYKVS